MGVNKRKPDFGGYATKAGLVCSDGRTILPDAFKHQDSEEVPLVWQHNHDDAKNVLGHAILENREDGVYAYGFFNDTDAGQHAKTLVEHRDIKSLSIYANQLVERARAVSHGVIREVSLVLAGANPGALIDTVELVHQDGSTMELPDTAVIFTGLDLSHSDELEDSDNSENEDNSTEDDQTEDDQKTIEEVYDTFTEEQKEVLHFMVGEALTSSATEEADAIEHGVSDDKSKDISHMTRNVFENDKGKTPSDSHVLSHDAVREIAKTAMNSTKSLKAAVEAYALAHGINDIELLFPDAQTLDKTPEFDKRRTEWVSNVLGSVRTAPFSRIKSIVADITQDQARAKGYIKGNLKKEEWFGLTKRTTSPTTIYKKQKLDRDDIIDITDFDVVMWLKAEMRLMLDEEIARAILIGDGRDVGDDDKIADPMAASSGAGIRSILNEDDLYAATVPVNIDDANSSYAEVIDKITRSMRLYKGSGRPTLYTTNQHLVEMLLLKDGMDRRLYRTKADLAAELNVEDIVEVEVMDTVPGLIGIIVNLRDYTVGTDRGGQTSFFDDFDIDYNQYKYLIEGRMSGALTKIRSALVIKETATGSVTIVTPVAPSFNETTGVITPATTTGVTYKRADTNATVTTGAPITLAAGASLTIYAIPSSASYELENNVEDEWTFTRDA